MLSLSVKLITMYCHRLTFWGACFLFHLLTAVKSLSTPTLLTQFPPTVRIENIAILPNSTLIVCNAFTAELYGINPLHGPAEALPYFVTSFAPHSQAIFGLTSPSPHTIAATASNFSFGTPPAEPPSLQTGSNVVYRVTLAESGPQTEAFPIPSAGWLNGLTPVPGAPHYFLLADCLAGALLRLDTRTGAVGTVSSDPLFAANLSSELPLGINGVHAANGWVYFTNTDQGLYGRLAITADGWAVGSPAEVIAHGIDGSTFDDFALGRHDTGYLATGLGGVTGIEKISSAAGKVEMVAEWDSGSPNISQPVSAVFGQTDADQGILYFATSGQYFQSGTPASGAQVFALDVRC